MEIFNINVNWTPAFIYSHFRISESHNISIKSCLPGQKQSQTRSLKWWLAPGSRMLLWRIATWTSTLPPSLTWLGLSGPSWGGNRCEACSGISELYICITEFWRCRSLRIPLHSWRISLSDLKNWRSSNWRWRRSLLCNKKPWGMPRKKGWSSSASRPI